MNSPKEVSKQERLNLAVTACQNNEKKLSGHIVHSWPLGLTFTSQTSSAHDYEITTSSWRNRRTEGQLGSAVLVTLCLFDLCVQSSFE